MLRWLQAAGVGCAILVAAAACQGFGTSGEGPTPSGALDAALRAFRLAPSVEMRGHATYGGIRYGILLSMDSVSDVDGSVTLDGPTPVVIRGTAARLLFEGGWYFARNGPNTGGQWVQAPADPLVRLVGALTRRGDLAAAIRAAIGGDVTRRSATTVDGTKAIGYTSVASGVQVVVPTSGTQTPLEFHSPPGHDLSDDLSDLSLAFSQYGRPVQVTLPNTTINVEEPNTLPAHLVADDATFAYDVCDDRGCSVSIVVRNDGGRFGAATVTFTESNGGRTLGSCTTPVPSLDHRATMKVGCRLDFDRNTESSTTVDVNNPQL